MDTSRSTNGIIHRLSSSPSLLGRHDEPPRPNHKRSTSSPSSSVAFLQRLTLNTRPVDTKAQSRGKGSPTRRRLVKTYSGNQLHNMDQADGQVGHDKGKEAARRIVQSGK
jgi:hypothetical protein